MLIKHIIRSRARVTPAQGPPGESKSKLSKKESRLIFQSWGNVTARIDDEFLTLREYTSSQGTNTGRGWSFSHPRLIELDPTRMTLEADYISSGRLVPVVVDLEF